MKSPDNGPLIDTAAGETVLDNGPLMDTAAGATVPDNCPLMDTAAGETVSWTAVIDTPIITCNRPVTEETKQRKTPTKKAIIFGVAILVVVAAASSVLTFAVTKSSLRLSSLDSSGDPALLLGTEVLVPLAAFKYMCTNNHQCVQLNLTKDERAKASTVTGPGVLSLRVCEMTCGNGSMLPLPQSFKLTTPDTVAVDVESFSHSVTGRVDNSDLLRAMQSAFATELVKKKQLALGGVATAGRSVKVVASIQSSSVKLTLDTDESYDLAIASTTVTILANTIYGYRHALASLLQLVDWCDLSQSFRMVSAVTIVDKPAYKHRGIMLDTARNFIPVQLMHRLIRTMGMHKLNVLHLHLTDSSSFPLEIKADHRFNQYGLYQSNMAYTQVQVAALVAYAKVHGVKVIPEIDAPAHVGAGWQWGPDYNMGELALCWANNPWMAHCLEAPCGQLNPFNEYVYDLLDLVWTEIGAMFDSDVFHLGGDEVFFECWIDSPVFADKVRNKTNHAEYIEIWATFQERVQNKLWARDPAKRITLWSSDLTTSSYIASLPPDKVSIQSWNMLELNEPKRFTDAGYSSLPRLRT
ncbi:hypothetical protein H257_09222 [Aphanomyces astaci]|uniref:beta-N-acetylhexosaminidase n=1 Tax=Aphanomyces astaci TaxID=112090 RepID=W4GAP8_APHAT|nr:hypothetical protein H257_09222 [Aphanomyces astaci]ETV76762.1 hypothetical protein H257_09222 [Aphanomyces astaci]|eukprot:XP_009833674.1 hypothetical protein H257_09222 [Aphanomyces astaci]